MRELTTSVNVIERQEPTWSSKVDRWYQLDEVGFTFCEAITRWQSESLPEPALVILTMEGVSTVADQDFVASGGESPAKFVFTLPNICASALFQVMGIHTKVYCLNSGQATVAQGLEMANKFLPKYKCIWVLRSSPRLNENQRTVSLTVLQT